MSAEFEPMNTTKSATEYEACLNRWAKCESEQDIINQCPRPTIEQFNLKPEDWVVKMIHQKVKRKYPAVEV